MLGVGSYEFIDLPVRYEGVYTHISRMMMCLMYLTHQQWLCGVDDNSQPICQGQIRRARISAEHAEHADAISDGIW
jgi:hypothetical protein